MNKNELVSKVAEKSNLNKKDAAAAVNAIIDEITAAMVAGESIQLVGFGTFGVKPRAARTSKNPRTGETIEVAATKVPFFKVGKSLKDAVAATAK